MQSLPTLAAGQNTWRLPLSDQTAARLIEALLLDDVQQQTRLFVGIVRDDPAFAVWCVCRAGDDFVFHSTDDIGQWLANRTLDKLNWVDSYDCVWTIEQLDQMVVLAETSLREARDAERNARDDERAQAILLGLIHCTPRWLETCQEASPTDTTCMPDWLNQRLAKSNGKLPHSTSAPFPEELQWSMRAMTNSLRSLSTRLRRLNKLESEFERTLQREKLAALKELAYGASHEINNPLANISTRAQTLMRDEDDPARQHKLATINSQAFRAHEMITHLMQFARPPRIETTSFEVMSLLDDVVAQLADEANLQNTELVNESLASQLEIIADRDQLCSALIALVKNSLEALRKGGQIQLIASEATTENQVQIKVHDSGPGIPQELRPHIFDPFFSGREAGRGLGFGLCNCWSIVEKHRGKIDVESDSGNGTTFTIQLPAKVSADQRKITRAVQ